MSATTAVNQDNKGISGLKWDNFGTKNKTKPHIK